MAARKPTSKTKNASKSNKGGGKGKSGGVKPWMVIAAVLIVLFLAACSSPTAPACHRDAPCGTSVTPQ